MRNMSPIIDAQLGLDKWEMEGIMKIVTWNMAWWSHKTKVNEAWNYLYNDIKTDVALLTEMGDPAQSKCPFPYFKWQNIGMNRMYWGSGIVSRYPLDDWYNPPSVGALITALLPLEKKPPISLICMYGIEDKASNSYVANLHRFLSDLTPILNSKSRSIIIGGDWNADVELDGKHGNSANANRLFFERLKDFGLQDCLKPSIEYPVQTHRHNSDENFPWQLDYIYATSGIANKVTDARVIDNQQIRDISDHNPIEIVIDI
jgi:Exonuclease III